MKKILALLMAAVLMCFSFCGCGDEPVDIEEMVKTEAENTVYTKVYFQYGYYPTVNATYVRETGENEYSVSGKVRVADKYGDQYVGTFDSTVKYYPEDGEASARSTTISDLYKE